MPVGYGDNPPVGPGSPEAKREPDPETRANTTPGEPSTDLPPKTPQDDAALTSPDSTAGASAPPRGARDDVGSTSTRRGADPLTTSTGSASGGKTPIDQDGTDGSNGSIDAPRLTPQGRASPDASGTDTTAPSGKGAAQGQPDRAEG